MSSSELVPTEVATSVVASSDLEDEMASLPAEGEQLSNLGSQGLATLGSPGINVFSGAGETPFRPTNPNAATPIAAHLHLHRQQFQQNIGINIGLSEDEVRARLSLLESEAERRHQGLMEAMRATAEQNFANAEEEANSVHRQVVASLEATLANSELDSARNAGLLMQELRMRDHHLQSEAQMYRSAKQSFERSEQLREQNLQEVEGEKQLALLQFGSYLKKNYDEHVETLRTELAELRTEFSATEDEMYRQNDSLQDEVSSLENALRREQEQVAQLRHLPQGVTVGTSQAPNPLTPQMPNPSTPQFPNPLFNQPPQPTSTGTPGFQAPAGPSSTDPGVIPESLGALAASFLSNNNQVTATPPGLFPAGAPQPSGMPTASAGQLPPGLASQTGQLLGSQTAAPAGTPGSTGDQSTVALQQALLEAAKFLKGEKTPEEDKPKVKEADVVKLPDFPNPETYRSWKTATREAVRAASDRPDAAFKWILEVYENGASHEQLRDPGIFLTLDTKILAALTKVAKGELARQVLNFKESEAVAGRAVRGRQVLFMFEQHFKTNEAAGSLYSVEDLLKVALLGDDLTTFIYNWDSVVAGLSHKPDETTLRDIFLRQIRKSTRMKYDLEIYDRAKEGTSTHSYEFLVESIRNLLNRERMRKNRDRIAKSHGDRFGAPVLDPRAGRPPSRGGRERTPSRGSSRSRTSSQRSPSRSPGRSQSPKRGVCYDFQKGKCKKGDKCKYEHRKRDPSPKGKSKEVCTFWKKGKCTRGNKCRFLHKDRSQSPSAAPTAEAATPASKPEKARSPSPAPKNKRKPSRGRSREKDKHAACCVSFAAAAPAGSREEPSVKGEDYWEVDFKRKEVVRHHCSYRSEMFNPTSQDCPMDLRNVGSMAVAVKTLPVAPFAEKESWNWRSKRSQQNTTPWVGKTVFKIKDPNRKLRFSDKVRVYQVPMDKCIKLIRKPRQFSVCYLDERSCPKSSKDDREYAKNVALELANVVQASLRGESVDCDYECEDETSLTCECCENFGRAAELACPSAVDYLEFLADTGSEEDLISRADHAAHFGDVPVNSASRHVNLITANGSIKGDKSVQLEVPEFGGKLECYLLDSTPPVFSVGRRCMEDGFEFHWYPKKAPYFISPEGKKLRCRVRGMVPVIASDTLAAPAIQEGPTSSVGSQVFSVPEPHAGNNLRCG